MGRRWYHDKYAEYGETPRALVFHCKKCKSRVIIKTEVWDTFNSNFGNCHVTKTRGNTELGITTRSVLVFPYRGKTYAEFDSSFDEMESTVLQCIKCKYILGYKLGNSIRDPTYNQRNVLLRERLT